MHNYMSLHLVVVKNNNMLTIQLDYNRFCNVMLASVMIVMIQMNAVAL
jgi:hypothetical protein